MKFTVIKGKIDSVCAIKSWGLGGRGEEGVEV